jgi:hypothetical protein
VTEEELVRLINTLPNIDTYNPIGSRCYAFSYDGAVPYEVLLDNGMLVNSGIIVKQEGHSKATFKNLVKELLTNKENLIFLGVGNIHEL